MPEVTRVVRREYRTSGDHDYESDDDRSTVSRSRHGSNGGSGSYRTVQRYRVTPSRVEEVDRDGSRDDDRRSIASPRSSRLEIDRFEGPTRPKSSTEARDRQRSTVVERYVDRREPEPEREREFIRERIIERREPEREREPRTVVYEERREERREDRREEERPWDRRNKPWEDERNFRETDVKIEKRTTERREEPYEVERYQRETEYYEPSPAPIIIRQRAPEPQQIIVQEAPAPLPIIIPRQRTPERVEREEKIEVTVEREREREPERRREPKREEDEYYYRRDVREVHDGGPTRRDKEWALGTAAVAAPLAVAAYRHRERRGDREVHPRDSISDDDYSDDESGYIVRRRVVTKDRSRSHSPHHKRHLAEGALAGAGIAAIVANHRDKVGNGPDHRGRNVAGGAALGALGAEVITRARSRYREREEDRDQSRSRSRSTSRHSHRKVKTGLALAAAGLAAVAATQYVKNRKANKEEAGRGRSRSRRSGSSDYSDGSDYDNRSRSRGKHADPAHRRNTIAKAGAATAAVAAVANHFRSKSRGKSRSKSRIRTGAEIAGAGLAGAAVAGLYENRKAKEERAVEEEDDVRRRSRSRSRSRSRAKSNVYKESRVDPELGLVQYGTDPVDTRHTAVYDPAAAGAAYGAARSISRSRSRSHGRSRRHRKHSDERNSRSRSRVRDIAGAAAGTAAAAIGISQYQKRKEKKEAERERVRREYEASPPPENYYAREYNSDQYTPSPPHASGGSYFPQTNSFAPPPIGAAFNPTYDAAHDPNFHYEPNTHLPPDNGPIPPYNPQDYVGQPSQANPVMSGGAGPAPAHGNAGDHVSTNGSGFYGLRSNPTGINLHQVPAREQQYFPVPLAAPTVPFVKPKSASEMVRERELEEAGLVPSPYLQYPPSRPTDPIANPPQQRYYMPPTPGPAPRGRSISPSYSSNSPNDTPTESEADPRSKSVVFAPLSPESSRRLSKIHAGHGKHDERDPSHNVGKQGYDSASGEPKPHHRRKHRRVRKRNRSDPSSNRPSGHRSSSHHRSRGGEGDEDSIEELPDRFDGDGKRIDGDRDRGGGGRGDAGGGDMVEKLAHDFGDVIDGRKSWKDLLGSFGELGGGGRH